MCQVHVPMGGGGVMAASVVCGPVSSTNGPSEQQRGAKRDWLAIPLIKDIEGRYAFEAILSASALPAMDSGIVSFVIIAAGMLGYLRVRKRYKFPLSSELLVHGQEILERWRKFIRAKLLEIFSRPEMPPDCRTPSPDAAMHAPPPSSALPAESHDGAPIGTAKPSSSVPPVPDTLQENDPNHNLVDPCDISDDGEELLSRRTPSPFHRFYSRLPGFATWTVVSQADVPSPSSSPHEDTRPRWRNHRHGASLPNISTYNNDEDGAQHDDHHAVDDEAWAGADVVDVETVFEEDDDDENTDANDFIDDDDDDEDNDDDDDNVNDDDDDGDFEDQFMTEEVEVDQDSNIEEVETAKSSSFAAPASPPSATNDKWYLRPFRRSPKTTGTQ